MNKPPTPPRKKPFKNTDPSRFGKPTPPKASVLLTPDNPLVSEARRLNAKKRFAQHFLIDPSVISRIVAVVSPQPEETVLEIGPGSGCITAPLLETGNALVAVELERAMISHLKQKFAEARNLTLIEQDFLRFDYAPVANGPFVVAGNLPYNISTPILFHLVGELSDTDYAPRRHMRQATLMVQKEVGERITASPGSRAYNALSVAVQYWCEAELNFVVPNSAFLPPPKVQSAVVTLRPRKEPLCPVEDLTVMQTLVRVAFHQKRKTLKNALLAMMPPETLMALLDTVHPEHGNLAGLRAESIPIEAFGALANAYAKLS